GPAASFAKMWLDNHPNETIGLIPCADGGNSIDDWTDNSSFTRHALSEARFAMETSDLMDVLWQQGEGDSQNKQFQTYESTLMRLITCRREALGNPQLPFVMGLLGEFLGQDGFGASATEYQAINENIKSVANKNAQCFYVT